ncbi:MAG: hypothetical protein ABW043_12315 [Devosia sp.]|uniref:hypothetical protein n=1 Tax=Devosia sp. TaxID=1871048 RepID=UPI003390C926
MALDHGALNIPLTKRGNIDAQLDRYKATEAKNARADRREQSASTAKLRIQAKQLVADVSDERIGELATKCQVTPADIRKQIKSDAHWQPGLVILLLAPRA